MHEGGVIYIWSCCVILQCMICFNEREEHQYYDGVPCFPYQNVGDICELTNFHFLSNVNLKTSMALGGTTKNVISCDYGRGHTN